MKKLWKIIVGVCILCSSQGLGNALPPAIDDVASIKEAMKLYCPVLKGYDVAEVAEVIVDESLQHGFDPLYVLSVIVIESSCNPKAVSGKGAVGMMQVMPSTAAHLARTETSPKKRGRHLSLRDPRRNIHLGTRYLHLVHAKMKTPERALTAYLCGDNTRRRTSRYAQHVLRKYRQMAKEIAWARTTSTFTKSPA